MTDVTQLANDTAFDKQFCSTRHACGGRNPVAVHHFLDSCLRRNDVENAFEG